MPVIIARVYFFTSTSAATLIYGKIAQNANEYAVQLQTYVQLLN